MEREKSEGRWRGGKESRAEGGGKKKERVISIVGGESECGRIRYSPAGLG